MAYISATVATQIPIAEFMDLVAAELLLDDSISDSHVLELIDAAMNGYWQKSADDPTAFRKETLRLCYNKYKIFKTNIKGISYG